VKQMTVIISALLIGISVMLYNLSKENTEMKHKISANMDEIHRQNEMIIKLNEIVFDGAAK